MSVLGLCCQRCRFHEHQQQSSLLRLHERSIAGVPCSSMLALGYATNGIQTSDRTFQNSILKCI